MCVSDVLRFNFNTAAVGWCRARCTATASSARMSFDCEQQWRHSSGTATNGVGAYDWRNIGYCVCMHCERVGAGADDRPVPTTVSAYERRRSRRVFCCWCCSRRFCFNHNFGWVVLSVGGRWSPLVSTTSATAWELWARSTFGRT